MSDDVVVKAEVSGPDLGHLPPQEMRAVGATREEAIHTIKVRAADQSDIFGTDSMADISIEHAEVLN